MLNGKNIVLGVTGSIAAYKSCLLIRELRKRGAQVQVVVTPAGREFVGSVTFSALTGKPVVCDFFASNDGTWHSHVDLGLWADAMIVAPCTASTLAKMATGVADNMLITTYLSMKAPVFVAPAMDLDMYAHPATQENISRLASRGVHIIEAESGFLASGLEGKGRMAEPSSIVAYLDKFFSTAEEDVSKPEKTLEGKKVLITAGPTYERIDPVRFIGNFSSGKMGFAIAEECRRRGADVTLIAGPVSLECNAEIHRIDVESCEEMHRAAMQQFPDMDISILAAAVADYRPSTVADKKLKREGNNLTINLMPTTDIAADMGRQKRSDQILVAFALETDNEEKNAMKKLKSKNADMIVLNSLRNPGTCFGFNENKIRIITPQETIDFELKSKAMVAADILNTVESIMK